jgi:hypothetical protein
VPKHQHPVIDAIRGNEIQVWGEDGAPPRGTLKTCNDGGAELLFEASDEVARGEVSTEPAVFFAGSQFVHEDSFSRPSTIQEIDIDDDPEVAARRKLIEMDEELRVKSIMPFDGPGFYIPIDSLHSVMTRDAIRTLLPFIARQVQVANDFRPGSPFDQLAQDIYGRLEKEQGKEQGTAKSYRKILAILILIGKADTIFDFVRGGITDAHLPLQKLGDSRTFRLGLFGSTEQIRLFRKWDYRHIEEFENKQWETLAPFFSRTTKEHNLVRHYELSWRRPLPFEIIPNSTDIGGGEKRATSGGTTGSDSSLDSMKGGHGKVWKVWIHPKHHNLQSYRVRT